MRRFLVYPHDLIKVIDWKNHWDTKYIDQFCDDEEFKKVVKYHHKSKGLWQAKWHEADTLSSVLARAKHKKNFWKVGEEEPVFVRVYGDILEFNEFKRKELWEKIIERLKKRDYNGINELLSEFPQDSRFPFVSLKTHHIITQILKNLMDKMDIISKDQLKKINKIYLIKISFPISEFHRLKELRAFIDTKKAFMFAIMENLDQYYPVEIGDDILMILLTDEQVKDFKKTILERSIPCRIEIFECIMDKRPDPVTGRLYYYVKSFSRSVHTVSSDELEFRREASTWARILEEEKYVAWLIVSATKPLHELAKEFVNWGFEELKDRGEELKEGWEIEEEISPDLLLAFVEGYSKFLEDVKRFISDFLGIDPNEYTPVSSIDYFIMVLPVDYENALNIYCEILNKREKLHVKSVSMCMIVADGKYPFWRIREFFESKEGSWFAWMVGESMYSLSDDDVRRVRNLIRSIQNSKVSKSVLYSIISKCGGMDKEETKLFIDSLNAAGKLGKGNLARELNGLVDYFSSRYGNEWREKFRWALKLLANFARRE